MKKILAAVALSLTLVLVSPVSAMAFNPQPDPPGKAAIAAISELVTSILNLVNATLCQIIPPDPVVPTASNCSADTHG
jgi:hypothetical protein